MSELEKAGVTLDECWEIFSMTGELEDGRMLIEAIAEYDLLLEQEAEAGL
ncbi:MAG: hypothetical protein IJX25_00790 [Clostridia bacterium]|nr:hypothetical protein [Clostridia bacterium]MBQ8792855.1 hypothetical protein [Clostridia bacterium]